MSDAVVLPSVVIPKRAAREVLVATRVPPPPKEHTGNPFTTLGDVVADCQQDGCGYHVAGDRRDVGIALREHHRLFHADEISVVELNHVRQ